MNELTFISGPFSALSKVGVFAQDSATAAIATKTIKFLIFSFIRFIFKCFYLSIQIAEAMHFEGILILTVYFSPP